jgi:hypothetical protein
MIMGTIYRFASDCHSDSLLPLNTYYITCLLACYCLIHVICTIFSPLPFNTYDIHNYISQLQFNTPDIYEFLACYRIYIYYLK